MKRFIYIFTGAVVLIVLDLGLEAISYTHPPQWFYPIWIVLSFIVGFITFPAHHAASFMLSLFPPTMQPIPLPKPRLVDLGPLYIGLMLVADTVEGALIGWFITWKKKIR